MKLSLSRLTKLKALPKETFLGDFTNFDSAKYNLITAIEAMIDICNHLISREKYELPATSSDSIVYEILQENLKDIDKFITAIVIHVYKNKN